MLLLHLAEISRQIAPDARAIPILDGAGYHLAEDTVHFIGLDQHRGAEASRDGVLPGESLDFDGKAVRFSDGRAEGDLAVMGEETGASSVQRRRHRSRDL